MDVTVHFFDDNGNYTINKEFIDISIIENSELIDDYYVIAYVDGFGYVDSTELLVNRA